ncbi:MAG: T9SS type A sorting domain-containing protein [Cytophagaceae bacterium]|jgi:hypothetical protein|nr:T9SS type A sorting domain-containing protein [Cytophagaceae bacterium]
MKSKSSPFFLLFILVITRSWGQLSISVAPETPLDYLSYELTLPKILDTYESRTKYFGTNSMFQIQKITQSKYSGLPLYNYYSELTDFIDFLETRTTVSKTTNYIAYELSLRNTSNGVFVVYSKDTFFLTGTRLDSISQTIYDLESSSPNALDTYAKYDVSYNASNILYAIQLRNDYSGRDLRFAGLTKVFDNTGKHVSDTIYKFGYDGFGNRKVIVTQYQDHYYNATTPLQLDSTYQYSSSTTPALDTKFTYTSNTSNELLTQKGFTNNSSNQQYEQTFWNKFANEIITSTEKTTYSALSIYPNPSNDVLHISEKFEHAPWNIWNADGKLVMHGVSETGDIPVHELRPGFYSLQISQGEMQFTKTFIKQ